MDVICDWKHDVRRCRSTAELLCGAGHAICVVHALDERNLHRRRRTDFSCGICGSQKIIRFNDAASAEQRRACDVRTPPQVAAFTERYDAVRR